MPTILSCTDGSIYASSVYDHTAWAAHRLSAEVHVLHILEPIEAPAPVDASGTIGIDAQSELMAELVTLAETQGRLAQARGRTLLAQAQRHFTDGGIATVVIAQQQEALISAIDEFKPAADLVVIGKRGENTDFVKLQLGRNLERVIRHCHQPVLVASRSFQPIARFLLAYDGSPSALKAVNFALRSPLLKGLHCHILRAGKIDDKARHDLDVIAGKLRQAGYLVESQATAGPADEVIADVVKEHRIDLLVIGAYGHSRIRELIVGSTTATTIRMVPTPVLMFR